MKRRIYLSPPHMSGREMDLVRQAFESNWIAPLGPHVDAFERELCDLIDIPHAVALSSGTAALHLALRVLTRTEGRRTKDHRRRGAVFCSSFTFSATANAIAYEGLTPVFIDCDGQSWCMDPGLLREELEACAKRGKLPLAVIVVDLYGQSADHDPILAACDEFGVPVIEDAAEALGATYWGAEKTGDGGRKTGRGSSRSSVTGPRPAGSFGAAGVFSFNGNKVITTSGGGMLVSHDRAIVDKARFLATQARDPAPHYQHSEIGFNYRISNILAAIGRAQLEVLEERVGARRRNFEFYQQALGDLPGVKFMPEAPYGRSTRWLTCLAIEQDEAEAKGKIGTKRNDSSSSPGSTSTFVLTLIEALEAENIEARPLWKPMHLQPVFRGCRVCGGAVSERLFETGLCLPSGSALTKEDLERISAVVRRCWAG
ncbi:MAG: DegT/DnrJ/EryC1/StrS family aminotransferase [candidate division WOR-3 bacterium]|nr:MAG: DegT/DnrJ/EryC1/StrS family aminotransferase [candidate division WOR-3 bacterium]